MLALGIPDKYAMQRIGHASNTILKNVYQHTMEQKQNEFSITLDEYFSAHTWNHATRNATRKNKTAQQSGFEVCAWQELNLRPIA